MMGGLLLLSATLCAQCPEITIDEKYDHVPTGICAENGWDTVVNCANRTLTLNAHYFITAQHFNGTYQVEQIAYNPVDPTFHAGQHLNISTDDAWENSAIQFPFTFMYFGQGFTQAVVGSNGIVSFNTGQNGTSSYVGQYCAYSYSVPIPSSSFPSLNSIYGVYEDIHPTSSLLSTEGMFRSVGGTFPCRYLCASVNNVPLYPASSHSNDRCTYQIVCYEGTNIIEVHVQQRSCCSSTNSGKGIIGLQNATGTTQVSHYGDISYLNDPSFYIHTNSPGAFVAPNRGNQSGGWTGTTSNEAWRFTPLGDTTIRNITWWRLFEDEQGHIIDSVELTQNAGDTNGYYVDRNHMQVIVSPTRTTRYVVKCVYQGANGYWYGVNNDGSMRDTITIGVDTSKAMRVISLDTVICEGGLTTASIDYDRENMTITDITWGAAKVFNGVSTTMPANSYRVNPDQTCTLLSQAGWLTQNHIDSVWIYCTATFANGCNNYDSILIRTYPNFVMRDTAGICDGEAYNWCGERYTVPGDYSKYYTSVPGCDSTHHLHLVVSGISHTIDPVVDCQAYTWKNGKTYTQDNDATRATDTIMLKNQYGCDSIVTLDFTLIPVTAAISFTPQAATYDELNITLTDESINSSGRTWIKDDGSTSIDPVTNVTFPMTGVDSITVYLLANSTYGSCIDTTSVSIPLHRVAYYIPNAFTPERPDNNQFRPYVKGNITELEMWIYDRSGRLVKYIKGADGYWDGTSTDGLRCPQGSYVYIMRFISSLEPTVTQQVPGTITLIR